MFVSRKEGLNIKFENGLSVSLQMGEGHYCTKQKITDHFIRAENAELAVINTETNQLITRDFMKQVYNTEINDDVVGHVDYDVFIEAMLWARKQSNLN